MKYLNNFLIINLAKFNEKRKKKKVYYFYYIYNNLKIFLRIFFKIIYNFIFDNIIINLLNCMNKKILYFYNIIYL